MRGAVREPRPEVLGGRRLPLPRATWADVHTAPAAIRFAASTALGKRTVHTSPKTARSGVGEVTKHFVECRCYNAH